jgi:hypothetical protein
MKIPTMKNAAGLAWRKNIAVVSAALLAAGAIGGWAVSTTFTLNAAAVEASPAFEQAFKSDATKAPSDDSKAVLIGSYAVTGTDPDGTPYAGAGVVDIALAPSGALELEWDNGKQVGVGQVIGNVLVVASSNKGRTAILIMNVNRDGSLSGKWSRRTDRGYKGTEIWKKT